MGKINILDASVANMIAAGEVVGVRLRHKKN